MATFYCAYFCGECQMGFDDEIDVRNHLSAEHHNYFPYKCFTCKSGAKHKTVSAEFMYEHTSTAHEGIEPDVRFSFLDFRSKQNELKLAIQNCRQPSAEQTFPNDSKILVPRVLISSGTTLDGVGNTAAGNISTSTENEFEVNANNDDMDFRLFMTRENELYAAVENCRRPSAEQVSEYYSKHVLLRDTLTDARDDTIENEVTSTEIKQENDSAEVDSEAVTHSTQLESGSALGNESNLNECLHENIEEIDSLVPPVSFAELPAIVETQQNAVDPITNSENILSLNAKPESTENVSIVPLRLTLKAALSSYVPIDVEANEVNSTQFCCDSHWSRGTHITRKKKLKCFDQFSWEPGTNASEKEEIHSIAHLWANGRVVADLSEYPERENEVLPVSDFCDGLFSQERSILKCKELEISLANSWPFSVVTNAAGHCNQLILTQAARDQQNALLDAFYERKLPQHIQVTLNLHSSKCMNEFIDKLKKRFLLSTVHNFKLTVLFPRNSTPPNIELQNEHGLTLTTTTQASHNEHCDSVMIEQHYTS